MELDFLQTGLSLPALRGQQGTRVLYAALPQNSVLNTFFPIDLEPASDKAQRTLDPRHARDIAEYVKQNPTTYALGAVTYAMDVPGDFQEVSPGAGIGLLRLPLGAQLRSIDGQHRREGIRLAIDVVRSLAQESTALLIYVEADLEKRRQMFSDMNNTAKKVSKAVNISFDSRDPFARVVNQLCDQHSLLAGRTEKSSVRVAPGSSKLFTLGAIHDAVKRLFVGPSGRVKDPFKYQAEEIEVRAIAFLDLLSRARPELARDARTRVESESLIFSSTTLRVIAGAIWKLCFDELGPRISIDRLEKGMAELNFSPKESIWLESGYVSPGRSTPNARSQEVQAATDLVCLELETRML